MLIVVGVVEVTVRLGGAEGAVNIQLQIQPGNICILHLKNNKNIPYVQPNLQSNST